MQKEIILLLLLSLILLTGCINNNSRKFCTLVKNSPEVQENDYNIYIENGICILDFTNGTKDIESYYIRCNSLLEYYNIILKYPKDNETISPELIEQCKITKI